MTGEAPLWVYPFCGICGFAYQTLDALDGKQARRTGMSGPLGELFDHGCDSLNVTITTLTIACTIQAGGTWLSACLMSIVLCGFFAACWEQYHTHTLFLPIINGPVEGCLIMVAAHIATYWLTPQWWLIENARLGGYTPRVALISFSILAGVITIMTSTYTVLSTVQAKQTKGEATLSKTQSLLQVVPILICTALWLTWMYVSHNDLLTHHPHLVFLTMGIVFSHQMDRMVLCHLVRDDYVTPWWLYVPLVVGVGHSCAIHYFGITPYFHELVFLRAYFGLACATYFFMASSVVRQIVQYLGKPCFHVPPHLKEGKGK
eukprot:TRINITY_DN208_c0_g1_i2.p1 TRINITY_DN208_c0_g1~~TRINITY_DN208_c0_g1_i2.p1  ORF type:complete len:318 (+),score=43.58 TRINITY_DN208_c0_g1_i2:551-1504(+)